MQDVDPLHYVLSYRSRWCKIDLAALHDLGLFDVRINASCIGMEAEDFASHYRNL